MKQYGIYLVFSPGINLRGEGLGELTAYILRYSRDIDNVRLVVGCPTWMIKPIQTLLKDTEIDLSDIDFITPNRLICIVRKLVYRFSFLKHKMILILGLITLLPVIVPALYVLKRSNSRFKDQFKRFFNFDSIDGQKLHQIEVELLTVAINKRRDIAAWYCPTLFWPSFSDIKKPVLVCAPDVVMRHFPIGFAIEHQSSYYIFKQYESSVKKARYFTDYSEDVKKNTLEKLYHIPADRIFTVRHGTNSLDQFIKDQPREQSIEILNSARKSSGSHQDKFIFYASQARVNKNILSLLKAFNALRKEGLIEHKLYLTANPGQLPVLNQFIEAHDLQDEVFWLSKISMPQLAACYHLADLSVNPTFAEGGFPFTFTESLSVETPVVMSRINVTDELITDPELNEMMLFDPYDWRSMAHKINWALKNKDQLLHAQLKLYKTLSQRTWKNVVEDYVQVLETISTKDQAR